MKLSSLIDKECIFLGDVFHHVDEAIDGFIDVFDKRKKLPLKPAEVHKIVRNREELGGTFLPSGIAIPHGRIEGFHDLLIGFWIPKTPVETEKGTVKAVIFTLTSKSGTALYLPLLAALAKHSKDEKFMATLLSATDRSQVQKLLGEIVLKNEITIEDIMTREPYTCGKATTLAELADLFYRKNLSFVPVVDDQGIQIGEVTVKDLLSRGIPDYVKRLENTRFLKTLEPFEALLREEDKITVGEIMREPSRHVSPDASIIEAATIITSRGLRHLPVLESGRVIGVVSEMDILKRVIRG